ncbi:zinc finger protein 318 isoform X2 [Betta splendens]|uniref:Zinc finger protein 318 isoform X2 n=1 Tax=Betta splendens TaxID=158456 RepID=A0A9W2XAN4_BETSP|nr:zinc finger protein 318 isoform X2 [Betta splendens]
MQIKLENSPPPRGPITLDHNLVITVGNELTGPPGQAPSSSHHDRDYPARSEYHWGRSPDKSPTKSRPHSRSQDRSRAKSRGRSKSRSPERSRAKSCGRSKSRSQDRSRAKSRGRSKSRSPERSRAKSRGRSKSRSPERSRAKSRGRSKSRSPERSRAKSRGRSKSRSPERSRAKSRGRSKSRSPERSRAKSRSQDRSRAKSRGRSRSRSRSKSRPHSRSRSRSRGRSRERSYRKVASHTRSNSRHTSWSHSSSSSSSSSSHSSSNNKSKKEFKELQMARRRKELEEMLSLPTKSILKKRNDSEDSPSVRSLDSPKGPEGSSMSRVADQLLQAVKGMEPHTVAAMLSELRSDPQMANRPSLDNEIKEILNLLGSTGAKASLKTVDDIDDEERYLYGDSEEPKPRPVSQPVQHQGLDVYGDVTEDTLYGDYPPPNPVTTQTYAAPLGAVHLPAAPIMGQAGMQYMSRPAIIPEQSITVQVSNPAFPPGTEPLEESERQALEEYEKIQDLLKTIGMDLGVVEISKMAARTKERLHGNKPPKTPTRRRRYSSGSSNGSRRDRRRCSHSSSKSRSRSRGHGGVWSSDEDHRKSPPHKSLKNRAVKEMKAEQSNAAEPAQVPSTPTPPQGVPIPTYPSSQVPCMMTPNYPPPGYSQYGNYLPYVHQQWPPMYPPPTMALPPQPALSYKPLPELEVKGSLSSVQKDDIQSSKLSSYESSVSEKRNNESQKQKVMEEREKLKEERDIRMKKKEYLMKELERLRKQQGELLRKKRREKDGHKDPLLQEISLLQEEVMTQIANLRKEHETAEKKRSEIEKVALILGLSPSDRPHRSSQQADAQEDKLQPPPEKKKREPGPSPETQQGSSSFTMKVSAAQTSGASLVQPPPTSVAPEPTATLEPFEYYDAGNHWCRNCNVTSGSMFDFFTHLHSKTHRKTLDPYNRPWASPSSKIDKNIPSEERLTKPSKGSEFLLPVRGFFCLLCKEFFGDAICAEEHVTTHAHNDKYKKQMYENPLYEQRRNLDRQAGLALETSGKKRKHEIEDKEKEEKGKHKKEKEKKKESEAANQFEGKREEVEDKSKPSKKEDAFKPAKGQEEKRDYYSKRDVDEKYKYSKKDDKYRYNRDEEESGKYSRRGEDDRYSRENYRYRRDYHDKCDDRPKHGLRDDEEKCKYSKSLDFRSKHDQDQVEGKSKAEKGNLKSPEVGKPEASKPDLPPKPYSLSKVLCGPSPAMRAKLRKQSLEAGKLATGTTTTSFGKFTWRKKENVLAKEAEKVAAEFIKDDEEAAKQQQSVEDSFAKSMAVAKEIAEKLAGQDSGPLPCESNGARRGRIRPNLPAPAAVLRKTTMATKPASLNTFLSIGPENTKVPEPPPKGDPLTKALNAQKALLETKPEPLGATPAPAASKPELCEAESLLVHSGPAPPVVKTVLPLCKHPPVAPKPTLSEAEPVASEGKPSLKVCSSPVSCDINPAFLSSEAKVTQSALIKIVPDVAAPGVPESEQIHTVFVKPPPFLKIGDGGQKSDKLKSNLAAAKAQELFGIFYSSVGRPGPSSITKPATNHKTYGSSTSPLPAVQTPKQQTQLQPPTKFQIDPQSTTQNNTQELQSLLLAKVTKPDFTASTPSAPTQSQSLTEVQISAQPDSHNSSPPNDKFQSQPPCKDCKLTQPDSNDGPPSAQTQSQPVTEVPKPVTKNSQPSIQTEDHTQADFHSIPQLDFSSTLTCPQSSSKSQILIASVWSLQPTLIPTPLAASSKSTSQTTQPKQISPAHTEPHNQPMSPKSESQITSQAMHAEHEPVSCTPQISAVLLSDLQLSLDTQHPQPEHQPEKEPQPKPGPKTRGKTTAAKKTPEKKTPPSPRLVRQTRYQTRRQQQSQSETELTSGDSDSVASDQKHLDICGPSSGLYPEFGEPCEDKHQAMELTSENLNLSSEMTSLDFEYDCKFE